MRRHEGRFAVKQLGATAQNRITILQQYNSACLHSATAVSSLAPAVYILNAALRQRYVKAQLF